MPELSRFLGIVIYMYYREHSPPHFHAEYGKFELTWTSRGVSSQGSFRAGRCI